MHNVWVRLNAVVFFALTVLLVLAILCSFSTYTHKDEPILKKLALNNLRFLRNSLGDDRATFYFDLHADFRPAFHWNLKQIFVFVVAEFETKKNVLNQVTVWDKIIESEDEALLKLKKQQVKYVLTDQGAELRNKTVTLYLRYDHMPLTGRLYEGFKVGDSFKLPGQYKLK
jgi:signal peptidase complex subunit 3